ncbi:MAG: DUF1192 domain-containing protein [Pseudomonadota bacterium]
MFDDLEPQKQTTNSITLGGDLSTLSVDDLDERIAALRAEIVRLETERKKKESHLSAAQSFFKS